MTAQINRTAYSLDTIKSENFSDESYLTTESRKILSKMFKYIRTFPLNEYDTELIRKDLIGMAKEAEIRKEPFRAVIEKSPKEFCNELIYAVSGITVPKGRPYLRTASVFYRLLGYYFLLSGFAGILTILLRMITGQKIILALVYISGYLSKISIPYEVNIIFYLVIGYLFIKAGDTAATYNSDIKHVDLCGRWGKTVFAISALTLIAGFFIFTGLTPFLLICISFVFSLIYIKGAMLNKKELTQ